MLNGLQLSDYVFIVFFIDIGNDITYGLVGLQILADDVDSIFSKDLINLSQDARHIVMNVN